MDYIEICGGKKLSGSVKLHGAKNSALPILAACVLASGECELHNCPDLTDVTASLNILEYLGCTTSRSGDVVSVDTSGITYRDIPDDLVGEMRSSIIFLGALLARFGAVRVAMPGGCDIGLRPIDLHLSALTQLGACVENHSGYLVCTAPQGLTGARITLGFPSVGATENAMIAATLAKGTTTIVNSAREPEIYDLANFLNQLGAKVSGAGESTITVEGVSSLSNTSHTVITDRIEAATYLCCGAITGSNICLQGVSRQDLDPLPAVFESMGCELEFVGDELFLNSPKLLLSPGEITTLPYPGFPTDAQAVVMSVCTVAYGTTIFRENIFECRYKHVGELVRMGAKIKTQDRVAVVSGVSNLYGTQVTSTDLRGGAALVVAGLKAKEVARVGGLQHIDRGYQSLTENLLQLGADVKRVAYERKSKKN